MLENGSRIHSKIEDYLTGHAESPLTSGIEGYWNSVKAELNKFSEVLATEAKLTHKNLHYVGKIDCVAKHCDK